MDSFLVYQRKIVYKIEQNLNKIFPNICNWFLDSKLSIHFEDGKRKVFATKQKLSKTGSLDIRYGAIQIKQYQDHSMSSAPKTQKFRMMH